MIADFVRILRAADIRVSPAETLDAAEIFDTIGFDDRSILKHALGQTLAKTEMEKLAFDEAFESYFRLPEETPPEQPQVSQEDQGDTDDKSAEQNSGEGQPQEGGQQGAQEGHAPSDSANQSLSEMLENNDMAALQAAMQDAATEAGLANAKLFTQQGMFSRRIMEAMGLAELEARIRQMNEGGETQEADKLRAGRARLFEAVQDFVERQIAMRTKNAGRLLREDALSRIRLSNLDKSDMKIMRELIRKLAKRLASRHSRRRKKAQRGMLDIRRTMRANVAYDGKLFNLAWRRVKVERPKLIVLCDVSGSVAAVSRFFLMFLYSLDEVMPKTRSFVFSNRAGEITDVLQEGDLEEAMENALRQYGGGSTDYGMSMMDLAEATLDAVDKKTTLMVLGDARSNYGDPGHLVLKEFYERAGRVIFLNPEPETVWDTGDSEMKKLGAYCTHKQTCNSVKHVERVLDDLLRLSS
ncbi:MAG: VWA domain-containing protein [Rhodobiaceae bacterium]